jgi:hypothetical protein
MHTSMWDSQRGSGLQCQDLGFYLVFSFVNFRSISFDFVTIPWATRPSLGEIRISSYRVMPSFYFGFYFVNIPL